LTSFIKYRVVIRNFQILNIDNQLIDEYKISYDKDILVGGVKTSANISMENFHHNTRIRHLNRLIGKKLKNS